MNFLRIFRHPVFREWLIIVILLCGLAMAALQGGWLWRIDQTLYDSELTLFERPALDDIVIIGVDQASLAQLGRWPWRRAIHATMINTLNDAGVKAIGLDVVLSELDNQDPRGDEVLSQAIANNGHVVLPAFYEVIDDKHARDILPAPVYTQAAAKLAHISAELDPDGLLRSTYLFAGVETSHFPQFALATLMLAEPERWQRLLDIPGVANQDAKANSPFWVTDHWFQIPFVGPPGTFKQLSYIDVLRGDIDKSQLKNKIILIGTTAPSMSDAFPTPVSGLTRAMAGVEIHANVMQALMQNIDLRRASLPTTMLFSVLLIFGLLLSYLWLSPRNSLLLTLVLSLLALGVTALLFRTTQIWVSPTIAITAMILAYPLWSWRKLEATQHYLDEELHRLDSEPRLVPAELLSTTQQFDASKPFVPDLMEQKIDAVKSATSRLRNLRRFVSDSLESLPEATVVSDKTGRIMLANSSANKLFVNIVDNADNAKLNGKNISSLFAQLHHQDTTPWQTLLDSAFRENKTTSIEAKHDNDKELLVQLAPSYSAEGQQTGSILTFIDISPLRESERRRDEALRFLSHDMRSPQASILTLLDLHHESPETMPVEKLTERVGKYARRTLTLADDFLRLAKAERARPQDFSLLDLHELLQDATEEAWTLSSAKGITVKLAADVEGEECWVNGDRDLITRTLMNLLSNAIKYSPPNTNIRCTLQRKEPMWMIAIADEGYGISEEDLPKLFGRFTRLRHEGQPEEDGIGLGLVFVKTVLARHGGDIHVTSKVAQHEHDAHGTTFEISLPIGNPA